MDQPSIEEELRATKLRALSKANLVRARKRAMREALKAGAISDEAILLGTSEYEAMIADWPILRLLKLLPWIAEARAFEVCVHGNVSPRKKVGELTFAKREELLKHVREAREGWKMPSKGV